MSSKFHVRAATAADADTIADFNLAMAAETEDRGLDGDRLRAGVRNAIGDAHRGRYLVATSADGVVAGCLLLTLEWSDWRNGWFWWIQSVYTVPEYRGQGVYRALYDHVLGEARAQSDVCGLRLYVEEENTRAQGVYEHLGMQRTHYQLFELDFS
jgi:ribosomal protein S18 acetylase RimI-like enzyme